MAVVTIIDTSPTQEASHAQKIRLMGELSAVTFTDNHGAVNAPKKMVALQKQHLIKPEDAVVVTRD
jgi:hypothetical protein